MIVVDDDQQVLAAVRRDLRAQAIRGDDQIGPAIHRGQASFEKSNHLIESNSSQTKRRFDLRARIGDDDDGMRGVEDRACPGRVLAVEADVDAAGQVRGGELQ